MTKMRLATLVTATLLALGSLRTVSGAQQTADLVVGTLRLATSSVISGGSVTATVAVNNKGKSPARNSSIIFWMVPSGRAVTSADAIRIAASSLGTTAPGKFTTVIMALPISPNIAAGTYDVIATVQSSTSESNTGDNYASSTLTVSTTVASVPTSTTLTSSTSATTTSPTSTTTSPSTTTSLTSTTTTSTPTTTSPSTTTTTTSTSGDSTTTASSSTPTSTASAPPTSSVPCDRYASPTGGGDGTAVNSPYRVSDFMRAAVAGQTLCLLDGVYVGADGMVRPPAGKSGTSTSPITVRALNDGRVVVDAEFKNKNGSTWTPGGDGRSPLEFLNNNWWIIEGIDFVRSAIDVCKFEQSSDVIVRRVICRDGNLTTNNHVVQTIYANRILFEDFAAFGPGRYTIILYKSHNITLRRAWVRHEGSVTNGSIGPKEGINLVYNPGTNNTCENCLATWYPISMPSSFSYTDGGGIAAGGSSSSGTIQQAVGPMGTEANPGDADLNTKVYGSISYLLPSYFVTAGNAAGAMFVSRYASNQHIKDTLFFVPPTGYPAPPPNLLYLGDAYPTTNTTLDRGSLVKPTGSMIASGTTWTLTNVAGGSSLSPTGAVPNPFTNTGSSGARLCYRYANSTLTSQALWPWPMNDRIRAATAAAGAYSGPCVGCSGGRGVRAAVNVTADIESILGAIPSQCQM